MKELFIQVLESFGYPYYLQGSLTDKDSYDDTFITFFTDYTDDISHYDNDVSSIEWNFAVILYSNNPQIVSEKSIELSNTLKAAGFIPQGKGEDVLSDEPTHTGWAMNFKTIEHIPNN